MKRITVNAHDMSVGLRLDDPKDDEFRGKVYAGVQRLLKRLGWTVTPDASIARTIAKHYRTASKGSFHCDIEAHGLVVRLEFWATTWKAENSNGHRHDFQKLERLSFLDRLRHELVLRKLVAWLRTFAEVSGDDVEQRLPIQRLRTTDERIALHYANNIHNDKDLGRPVPRYRYDTHSADGHQIEQGQPIYFRDRKGRLRRGRAYFRNSTQWMLRENQSSMEQMGAGKLLHVLPSDPRLKDNAALRRRRLEEEMHRAVRTMDYQRAHLLKTILFGDRPTYAIRCRRTRNYYAVQFNGYVSGIANAGRYDYEEAAREVGRVPEELELIGPDGCVVDLPSTMPQAA